MGVHSSYCQLFMFRLTQIKTNTFSTVHLPSILKNLQWYKLCIISHEESVSLFFNIFWFVGPQKLLLCSGPYFQRIIQLHQQWQWPFIKYQVGVQGVRNLTQATTNPQIFFMPIHMLLYYPPQVYRLGRYLRNVIPLLPVTQLLGSKTSNTLILFLSVYKKKIRRQCDDESLPFFLSLISFLQLTVSLLLICHWFSSSFPWKSIKCVYMLIKEKKSLFRKNFQQGMTFSQKTHI